MVPTGPGETSCPFYLLIKALDNQFNSRNWGMKIGTSCPTPQYWRELEDQVDNQTALIDFL